MAAIAVLRSSSIQPVSVPTWRATVDVAPLGHGESGIRYCHKTAPRSAIDPHARLGYSDAHRGKGPDGARARCGSDRLRPRRSKQRAPRLRRRSWREHGDVFEAHVGPRRLVFVMHPDAVEQVTVSGRQRYDKKGSYDVARKYLIGQGLVGSTGDLWRRQRKLMAPFFTRGVLRPTRTW